MKKGILKNLALFFVSMLLILIFLEASARISYPLYSDYNTEMWRYASQIKMSSDLPNLSHVHRPYSKGDFYGTDVLINSDGFRDYEYSVQKENSTYRILLLGDSVTFGWGVKFNDTFAKRLEMRLNAEKPSKKYSKYEIINTGVGNYNTVMESTTLKYKGLKYSPDLVILNYYINDAEPVPKKPFELLRYSYAYAFLWSKYQNAKVLFLKGFDYKIYYHNLYKGENPGRNKAEAALKDVIDMAKKNKAKILIVVYPEFHNFKNYEFNETTAFVSEISSSKNAPVLDLLPYYVNYEPSSVWVSFEDVHPNSLGHEIAANAIYEKLIKLKLIS